jgi:hypothetical protein
MGLGVMQCQCRAPRAAENEPFFDAESGAQALDIGNKMGGRVVIGFAKRRRAAGAALIEYHDPPISRVEKAPMNRSGARAGATVQKQRWHTAWISRLLPVHHVARIESQSACLVGFDWRVKIAAAHHGQV